MVLVTGANGAGKTNFLEALHLGTQGFSPRTRADAQMIRFGAQAGRVVLAGERAGTAFTTDVSLASHESRRASLNGSPLRSAEQLRSDLQTLVFTPDRLAVVKGAPATRRAYLDRSVGRIFPSKAQLPVEYAAAVGQRNAALRRAAGGMSTREALAPWSEAVVRFGTELVEARSDAVALLAASFSEFGEQLGLSRATLVYQGDPPTLAELDARVQRDLERGLTGVGPHLHDLRIAAGERDLRTYGSQGEQRIAVLALLFAECRALGERIGATPLVLLDDVLSELDGDRRRSLADIVVSNGQTVITATAPAALPVEPSQRLHVTPGRVDRA